MSDLHRQIFVAEYSALRAAGIQPQCRAMTVRADLWLDGSAAIDVAEAAEGVPGWPPLQRLVAGQAGTFAASLAEALRDREAGWPLGCYMYPVPRGRVEQALAHLARAVDAAEQYSRERDEAAKREAACIAALRGDDAAIRKVALELARLDRRARAS